MRSDSLDRLDSVIVEASTGLFESLSVPVEVVIAAQSASREAELASSIGFASTALKGNLLLLSDDASILRCLPPELRATGRPNNAAAWIGELSNQLLGRIKNRLLPYGIVLAVGTPAVIRGLQLSTSESSLALARHVLISGAGTWISVVLEAESREELDVSAGARKAYCEGEGTLF